MGQGSRVLVGEVSRHRPQGIDRRLAVRDGPGKARPAVVAQRLEHLEAIRGGRNIVQDRQVLIAQRVEGGLQFDGISRCGPVQEGDGHFGSGDTGAITAALDPHGVGVHGGGQTAQHEHVRPGHQTRLAGPGHAGAVLVYGHR